MFDHEGIYGISCHIVQSSRLSGVSVWTVGVSWQEATTEAQLTSSSGAGSFIPTTYTVFFTTTRTPSKCLRPMLVSCLMVFARRVFFSFARLTLQRC